MKTLVIFLFVSIALASGAVAQRNQAIKWAAATVYLTKGDSVQGAVTYYPEEAILQMTNERGGVQVYTPVLVRGFLVPDPETKATRVFKTYFWSQGQRNSSFQTPAFFELVKEGTYSVLKREKKRQEVVRTDPYWNVYGTMNGPPGNPVWVTTTYEELFIHTPEGKVIGLSNPKKDLFKVLINHQEALREYIDGNRLQLSRSADLARVITYYNRLIKNETADK